MKIAIRHGLLVGAAAAGVLVAILRTPPAAVDPVRVRRPAALSPSVPPGENPRATCSAPPRSDNPIASMLVRIQNDPHLLQSPDVLTGPLAIEGAGRADPDAPPDLSLTSSQREIVEALLRDRRRSFDEVRREAEGSPQSRESADALTGRARRAQEACLASIRDCLLPDQRTAFDGLVQSGKWGGYTIVIPIRR